MNHDIIKKGNDFEVKYSKLSAEYRDIYLKAFRKKPHYKFMGRDNTNFTTDILIWQNSDNYEKIFIFEDNYKKYGFRRFGYLI